MSLSPSARYEMGWLFSFSSNKICLIMYQLNVNIPGEPICHFPFYLTSKSSLIDSGYLLLLFTCLVWKCSVSSNAKPFPFHFSGILAAIDTFSEHIIIGVSWTLAFIHSSSPVNAGQSLPAKPFKHLCFRFSEVTFIRFGALRMNVFLLQIFYFVGFGLFCLETLLSIAVLQV